jgi:hypothetical protein
MMLWTRAMRHKGLRAVHVDKIYSVGLPARLLKIRMPLTITAMLSLPLASPHDRDLSHDRLYQHDLRLGLACACDPEERT